MKLFSALRLSLVSGLLAVAMQPASVEAQSTTITSCVSKLTGVARIVGVPSACNASLENVVQWNEQGPQGQQDRRVLPEPGGLKDFADCKEHPDYKAFPDRPGRKGQLELQGRRDFADCKEHPDCKAFPDRPAHKGQPDPQDPQDLRAQSDRALVWPTPSTSTASQAPSEEASLWVPEKQFAPTVK